MAASPFERNPLQSVLVLLAGAALYTVLLQKAIGLGAAWSMPQFMRWIGDPHARFWVWNELFNTVMVVLTGLPFAWLLARFYARRLLPAALVVVVPTVLWMGVDYLAMRDEAPDAPAVLNIFYAVDAVKVLLAVPLMSLLLRARGKAAA